MTTAQVVETPVTVNNNSLIQDYVHPDDQTQPTFKYCMLRKDIWLVVNKILGKKPKTYSTWKFQFSENALCKQRTSSEEMR